MENGSGGFMGGKQDARFHDSMSHSFSIDLVFNGGQALYSNLQSCFKLSFIRVVWNVGRKSTVRTNHER